MEAEQNQIFKGVEIDYELFSVKVQALKRKGQKIPNEVNAMPRSSSPSPHPTTTPPDESKQQASYTKESYEKFRSRLEKPLRKSCHRGRQPKDASIVSSHIVVDRAQRSELSYTCIMTFPKSFKLEEFEAQEDAACNSRNWEQCFQYHIEHVVYYVPYVCPVQHYFTEPLYYQYAQCSPYYYPL